MYHSNSFVHLSFCCVAVMYLILTPTNAYEGFDLSYEEELEQKPIYAGWNADELYALCQLPNGTYDFTDKDCIANDVHVEDDPINFPDDKGRDERLKKVRQANMVEVMYVARFLTYRLEFPSVIGMIQYLFFVYMLFTGFFLIWKRHIDLRPYYVEFFKDKTRGFPAIVYLQRKHHNLCYVLPPPKEDDPDMSTYVFNDSDPWSSEEDPAKPKMEIPVQQPGKPPIVLRPRQIRYLKLKLKYDEYGYPKEYRKKDDKRIMTAYQRHVDHIAARDQKLKDREAAKVLPEWRIQQKAALRKKAEDLKERRRRQKELDEIMLQLPTDWVTLSPEYEERLIAIFDGEIGAAL